MDEISKRNDIITKKILSEINEIDLFTANMSEADFYTDPKTQKAVVMTLINIGELSKSYTDEFISLNKNIPWKKVQAMRNVAAHRYEAVNMERVWDTVKVSIIELKKELTI
ncbi:MAG: DUF86 domain-containing protein [Oscillospiraceae bacterium]|nr:DUF86 domain-containing protein [Oscillospiraceae bacterium]